MMAMARPYSRRLGENEEKDAFGPM